MQRGVNTMKNGIIILVSIMLVLFFSGQVVASDTPGDMDPGGVRSMAEAIKHAETAKTHKAHADHIHEHAKESLKYVKKAEMEAHEHGNTAGKEHITESIQHLVEAIKHAEMGHARIAAAHVEDALVEMYQFMNQ